MGKKHTPFPFFFRQIHHLGEQDQNINNCICITGFPYDEGTRLNNGRVGAEVAPKVFRDGLNNADFKELSLQYSIKDTGDLPKFKSLPEAHELQHEKISKLLKGNATVFAIGGSNDQSFPNAQGLISAFPENKIGVINIDAHMDCRPLLEGKLAHSGSPFRQLLDYEAFNKNESKFVNFANQGAQTSQNHYNFIMEKGQKVVWLNKHIRRYELKENSEYKTQAGNYFYDIMQEFIKLGCEYIFVSFDVDAIHSIACPGVSAPSVIGGLSEEEAIEIMQISGLLKQVRLVDFSEFNPAVENTRTAYLLSKMFYHFCIKYNERLL